MSTPQVRVDTDGMLAQLYAAAADETGPRCWAAGAPWACTLDVGHKLPHLALGVDEKVLAAWPLDDGSHLVCDDAAAAITSAALLGVGL